jgi:hypothetical protein
LHPESRTALSLTALGEQFGWARLDAGDDLLDQQVRTLDVQSEPPGSHLPGAREAPNQLRGAFLLKCNQRLQTSVWLNYSPALPPMVGVQCSCGERDCVHAAALLLYYLRGRSPDAAALEAALPPPGPPRASLDPAQTQWLQQLQEALAFEREAHEPKAGAYRLLYLLQESAGKLAVHPVTARQRKCTRK